MDIRRGISGLGRTLIASGVLILMFVAYQLWGTNFAESRSQEALFDAFNARVGAGVASAEETTTSTARSGSTTSSPAGGTSSTTVGPTSSTSSTSTSTTAPKPILAGDAIGIIRIPKLGVEKAIVEGVSVGDLKKAPGHYPGTPMPGQPGNAAIAGHRTTYGAPFYRLDELEPGDAIEVQTYQGTFTYNVRDTAIVSPDQAQVLDATDDNRLTLTTCHPRFSARQRMIVVADLAAEPAPAPPPSTPTSTPGEIPGEDVPEASLSAGLSGESTDKAPALIWGLGAAAIWLATWLLSRRWGKLPAYVLGTPLFLLVLFVFFENVSRLLPANV
ncbi:MAG: class E sortase [Acidimicrobiales bacterium]